MLKYALRKEYLWGYYTCAIASRNGNLDCLQYAYENGCTWNHSVINEASQHGHLNCLRYAFKNGCKITLETFKLAVFHNQYDTLKYCYKYLFSKSKNKNRNKEIYTNKIHCYVKCVKCLSYLIANGFQPFKNQYEMTIQYDNINVLQYLTDIGYKWDTNSCKIAFKYGSIKCLKYLRSIEAPWPDNDNYPTETAIYNIKTKYYIDCLYFAYKNGCPYLHKYYSDVYNKKNKTVMEKFQSIIKNTKNQFNEIEKIEIKINEIPDYLKNSEF